MPKSDDETPPTTAQRRYISQSITSLFIALDDLHEDMATTGEVVPETRQTLMSELASVIVQLRQWRDEDHVDWQQATPFEGGPEQLLTALLEGDSVKETPNAERNAEPRDVPQPANIPTMTLYKSAMDIIDVANNLGLTSPVAESNESVEAEI